MKRHRRTNWAAALIGAGLIGFAPQLWAAEPSGAPGSTNNPIAAFYNGPEGYPAWTDGIAWERIIDMRAYAKGKTNFEKFENARDELAAQGGGVLYYPAGTYEFTEGPFDGPAGRGLMLRRGVVIRGEAPAGKPLAARDGTLPLATRFVFGTQKKADHDVPRDWNLIGLMPEKGGGVGAVTHVGIAWVQVIGATVFFGPELKWGPTWAEGRSWKSAYAKPAWRGRVPNGTHPYDPFMGALKSADGGGMVGAGANRFVFGCMIERAAALNDYDSCGRAEAPEGFGTNGFHMAKFTARIAVYGSRSFVANNGLPQSGGAFLYRQTTVEAGPGSKGGNSFRIGKSRESTVMWDPNRTMGIDVNKDLFAMVAPEFLTAGKNGYFEEGVTVRDNWVFNHGQKGFNLSGKWVTISGNRNERMVLNGGKPVFGVEPGWCLTLDGFIESSAGGGGMVSDNLARAFDLGGSQMWIDGNSYTNTGSCPGNDGEGILCQEHGGTHLDSWAITHNQGHGGGNGKGFIMAWAVRVRGLLIAWNKTGAQVGALNAPEELDAITVSNICSKVVGKGDQNLPQGKPAAPQAVTAAPCGTDVVRIAWKDASTNEIGFRVERRIGDGPWWTIACRPPQREASPANPPEWMDFLAPSGRDLQYRVAALSADETAATASEPTPTIRLTSPR